MFTRSFATALCITGLLALTNGIWAQDELLNGTQWDTQYTDPDGNQVKSTVTLNKAKGAYESFSGGQSVGEGTFSQVRVVPDKRKGSPLPGPGAGGNWGLPAENTMFIKGLWHFGDETGWFSWELYEVKDQCKFVGKWGYVEGGTAGPTKGPWSGTLSGGGGGSGPVVEIP